MPVLVFLLVYRILDIIVRLLGCKKIIGLLNYCLLGWIHLIASYFFLSVFLFIIKGVFYEINI